MTTDGIRRKPQIAKGAPVEVTTKVDATNVAPGTAGGATAKRALDALDDVKGSATASRGRQGVYGALVGLAVVEPKASKWNWRAATSGALLGLTLLGGANPALAAFTPIYRPPVQHSLVQDTPMHNALSLRMMAGAPPPPQHGSRFAVDENNAPSTTEVARPALLVRGGLPDKLATLHTGMTVVHGSDPGDFYCEHAFFTTTAAALRADSTILRNAAGEVLTGFLHVPSDRFTYGSSSAEGSSEKVQAERHSERRDIVGAAIRGFYEDARLQLDGGDFRMLLTGYLQWGGVTDNPTGDFTGHTENVDAAMHRAFGADLLTRDGRVVDTRHDAAGMKSDTLEYRVKDVKAQNGVRVVLIQAAQLPVTDAAINGSDSSLQRLIERGRPHAVMSMGVTGGSEYKAEFHADDGGLRVDDDTGAITHDDGKSPMTSHPDNYALGRAIHRGHELNAQRPIVIATSTVVRGGD